MSEIVFLIENDPEGGYTARALGIAIFTQGDSQEQLEASIRDAMSCHFHDESSIPPVIRLHHVRDEVISYA